MRKDQGEVGDTTSDQRDLRFQAVSVPSSTPMNQPSRVATPISAERPWQRAQDQVGRPGWDS